MAEIIFAKGFFTIFRKHLSEHLGNRRNEEAIATVFHSEIESLKERMDRSVNSSTSSSSSDASSDKSPYKHLNAGLSYLQYAFESFLSSTGSDAVRHLNNARDSAARAFHLSLRYSDKIMATRIRILAIVFIGRYDSSRSTQLENMTASSTMKFSSSGEEDCYSAFYDFLTIPHVNLIIRDNSVANASDGKRKERKFGTSQERLNITREVNSLVHFVSELMGNYGNARWRLPVECDGEAYDLSLSTDKAVFAGHSAPVKAIAIVENRLFTGSADCTIRAWNIETLEELGVMEGHAAAITCLLVHGQRLYSSSMGGKIRIWGLESLACLEVLSGHSSSVYCLAVGGGRLYSGSADKTVKIWDINTLEELGCLQGHSYSINCLVTQGNRLFTGSSDRCVKIWNTAAMSEISQFIGDSFSVSALAIGGSYLFGAWDSTIQVWDLETNGLVAQLQGHSATIWSLVFVQEEGLLYSNSFDDTICVWNVGTLSKVRSFANHTDSLCSIAVSNGRLYSGCEGNAVSETMAA